MHGSVSYSEASPHVVGRGTFERWKRCGEWRPVVLLHGVLHCRRLRYLAGTPSNASFGGNACFRNCFLWTCLAVLVLLITPNQNAFRRYWQAGVCVCQNVVSFEVSHSVESCLPSKGVFAQKHVLLLPTKSQVRSETFRSSFHKRRKDGKVALPQHSDRELAHMPVDRMATRHLLQLLYGRVPVHRNLLLCCAHPSFACLCA